MPNFRTRRRHRPPNVADARDDEHMADAPTEPPRYLVPRDEHDGLDRRHLVAHLDAAGDLHIDGQDLGPATAIVSGDGEYEWFQTIPRASLDRLLVALGADPGDDVLDVLERSYREAGSYELEALLRSGVVPVSRQVWSG